MMTKRSTLGLLVRAALIFGVIGAVGGFAANSSIGMATASGSFQVDHARVWSNATLFSGSSIETAIASSDLQLAGGVQVLLAANSRATVYEHRLVLEAGYGQLTSSGAYEVEARSLRIRSTGPDTVARIRLEGSRKVTVAALRGMVQVLNSTGMMIARVDPGTSLDLEPQAAGAVAPTRASGCLLVKDGKFLIAEQTTNVTLEVHGTGLAAELGNRVEIVGQADGSPATLAGASQLITVAGLKQVSRGGCTAIAKKLGAATVASATAATAASATGAGAASGTAAGAAGTAAAGTTAAGAAGAGTAAGTAAAGAAAATAGIGVGTVAVIGGVAAAATVGGLAAVGSLPGQSENQPSISR